jgi:type II secretory pathway component PulM
MAGATLMEPVRERFSELVASMSPRDRALFMGLVVFVVVVLLGGIWWISSSILGDVQSRVDSREEALSRLQALSAENASAMDQSTRIEAELRKNAGQDLPSFIEKKTEETGLSANLQGVREKQVTTEGTLEEKLYSVEVTKISLQQLTSFLHAIETDGYPLRVRTTKIKSVTQQGVKLLNVTMEVSAFRLTDADAAPSAPDAEENP